MADADVLDSLLPRPRRAVATGGRATVADPTVRPAGAVPAQGYRLRVTDREGVTIEARDHAGERHARATLAQLTGPDGTAPCCEIEDHPALAVRGVMLDVSRDKVPTLQTLRDLVTRLAGWKVNHVQLYLEHTFAYHGHEVVWRAASPYTGEHLEALDEHCRSLGVELTANQNCLGHMERWLAHERYRPLAVRPDGIRDRHGRVHPPTTLDPAEPGALALVRDLLGQLLPHFTSHRVHVGLDEPWELPEGRMGDYLDWLQRLRALPELDGRQMLVWGDILARHPSLLPRAIDGVTVCEWGYEADHPFAERAAALAHVGQPFWLCPGTSAWNSLTGRWSNARANCLAAARIAAGHGAEGVMTTDWGDNGHLQYLPVSEAALAYAAAVAWAPEANAELPPAALSRHVFDDPTGALVAALELLGDAHTAARPRVPNISVLCLPLYRPRAALGTGPTDGLEIEELEEARDRVAAAVSALDRSRPARPDGSLVLDEVRTAAGLLDLLCRDGIARLCGDGTCAGIPAADRRKLADELTELADTHRRLWLARNRPGGLDDSTGRLARVCRIYREE